MTRYSSLLASLEQSTPKYRRRAAEYQASERWLYAFLALQFICQCSLMAERLGGRWRIYFRAASFLSSLAILLLMPGHAKKAHPAMRAGLAMMGAMGLSLLHPNTNTVAGIAHWILNLAIWAPLFWVGRIAITARVFWNALLMLWAFHVASSIVGVLQIYYPERFSPSAEFVRMMLGTLSEGLRITLNDGKQVWRPFGLSDSPGGAAASGSFAVVSGLVLLLSKRHWLIRSVATCGVAAGTFCIYICEIRSLMVVTFLGACVMIALQVMQKRLTRAAASLIILPIVLFAGIAWTQSIGGDAPEQRLRTLTNASASQVYYQNRGIFLESTLFEDLPAYPLGAGLGRYGMMYTYFGDPTQPNSSMLWVELQITGWLFDGGIPLVFLGYLAVLIACYTSFRIAVTPQSNRLISDGAAIVTALNAGWLAMTFSYPLFIGQGGMIFWLLNTALFVASLTSVPSGATRRSEST